jgi:hypothetical protein
VALDRVFAAINLPLYSAPSPRFFLNPSGALFNLSASLQALESNEITNAQKLRSKLRKKIEDVYGIFVQAEPWRCPTTVLRGSARKRGRLADKIAK